MNRLLFQLYKQIAFKIDPEKVHDVSLIFLEFLYKTYIGKKLLHERLIKNSTEQFNITFDNPIVLAAGFDKNAEYLNFISNIGFGFVEVGTLTPKAQSGNPKPRVFRVTENEAIINHLGFNNKGIDFGLERIKKFNRNIPIGVNIGKNASTDIKDAYRDYEYCLRKAYSIADYITLNISSPNTERLRDLQKGDNIDEFLHSIKTLHDNLKKVYKKHTPLVVKIAPDLTNESIYELSQLIDKYDIDGVICTNTTIDKSSLSEKYKDIQGGLSGKPLSMKSNSVLRGIVNNVSGDRTIIGVGGIDSWESANEKLSIGANLLQLYTGLVYKGPKVIRQILHY